jgi:hypothetical protein
VEDEDEVGMYEEVDAAKEDDAGRDEGEGKRGGVTPSMSTSISSPGPTGAGADGKTTRSIARMTHSPLASSASTSSFPTEAATETALAPTPFSIPGDALRSFSFSG